MTHLPALPKPRRALALAALLLSSMCTMGDLVIGPVVADVYQAFADSPEWLVNLGVTGPALAGLPFGLATGALCDRFDKKWIMVAGFAAFTVGAVLGAAIDNVYYFVAMRLLATGVGWGITNTTALSILADLSGDDCAHGRYVGWYNSAMSVIGAALAAVAGGLAVGDWQDAYLAYLAAPPVLAMLVAFLPSFPPPARAGCMASAERYPPAAPGGRARALFRRGSHHAGIGWCARLAPLALLAFAAASLYFVMLYLISLYVTDTALGDEAFTGMLTSAMTVATAVGSLAFGACYQRLGNTVHLPALLVIAGAFFALALFPNAAAATASVTLAGLAWPFCFCFFYTRCTELAPASKASAATSIIATANGLAVTGCSFLLTGAIRATGGTCLTVYPLFGALMALVAVLAAAGAALARRKAQRAARAGAEGGGVDRARRASSGELRTGRVA